MALGEYICACTAQVEITWYEKDEGDLAPGYHMTMVTRCQRHALELMNDLMQKGVGYIYRPVYEKKEICGRVNQ